MLRPWRLLGTSRLQRCRVFDVDEMRFSRPSGGDPSTFYRITAPDWINVVPLTDADEVVFVRQYRFGTESFTLEIPGGMCDPGEEPLTAALRELREETGYTAGEMTPLGFVHPNPALQNNRCHSYLARGLQASGRPEPDEHEEIEVSYVPLAGVPDLIRDGAITHSLVVAAFHLLDNYRSR